LDIAGHDNADPFFRIQIRGGGKDEKNGKQYFQQRPV
jgi:hypothetical protein